MPFHGCAAQDCHGRFLCRLCQAPQLCQPSSSSFVAPNACHCLTYHAVPSCPCIVPCRAMPCRAQSADCTFIVNLLQSSHSVASQFTRSRAVLKSVIAEKTSHCKVSKAAVGKLYAAKNHTCLLRQTGVSSQMAPKEDARQGHFQNDRRLV